MDNVRVIGHHMEKKDLSVVFEELFLGFDTSAAEFMLEVVHHAWVFLRNIFILQRMIKVIDGTALGRLLGDSQIIKEFSGVLIAIVDSNIFGVDHYLLSDHEIVDIKVRLALVRSQDFFAV